MRVIVVLAELSNSVRKGAAEVRRVEHRSTLSATSVQRSALDCKAMRFLNEGQGVTHTFPAFPRLRSDRA